MKLPIAPIAALLLAVAPCVALAQEHVIDGQSIAGGEVAAVQDRCKELQSQQGTTGTQEPETTMQETNGDQSANDHLFGADGSVNLDAITLEQCQAGGFTDQQGD